MKNKEKVEFFTVDLRGILDLKPTLLEMATADERNLKQEVMYIIKKAVDEYKNK